MIAKTGQQIFVSTQENKFFTKSEYDHIGHDFNFEALGEFINPEFAKEIESEVGFCYMKKLVVDDRETCYFLRFYAEDFQKEDYRVITAYHNKADYYSIDSLRKSDLEVLGLDLKRVKKK